MELFNECIKKVLIHEGGFTDNPADRGNWTGGKRNSGELKGTNYGISAMSYPEVDIKNLTKKQAKEIYLRDYWRPLKLYMIDNANICLDIFDMSVNSGKSRAVKMAQKLARTKEDGVMGGITAKAINEYEGDFVKEYKHARIIFYEHLVNADGKYGVFLKGWINRVNNNYFINL